MLADSNGDNRTLKYRARWQHKTIQSQEVTITVLTAAKRVRTTEL